MTESVSAKTGNRAALVTGAGIGIGRGIAFELAAAGYDVAVNFNSSIDEAEEVCSRINAAGIKGNLVNGSPSSGCVRAVPIKADISKVDEIRKMFEKYGRHFDRLDIFVNNSGVTLKSPFMETQEETFDRICDVNFKGAFFCIQQAAKFMIRSECNTTGSIVVISSNHYKAHFDNVSVYGSVKAGLNKLAEHAAKEFAQYGIRVNVIAPGWTDTGAARMAPKETTYGRIPLKRWCMPEEIGKAVLYLSSGNAASVTGSCLVMDGGALLTH